MNILFPYMARWSSAHASRFYHLLTHVAELGNIVYVIQPPSRKSSEANDIDVDLQSHPNVHVITVQVSEKFWNYNFPMEKLLKKLYYTFRSRKLVHQIINDKNIDLLYLYNIPQFIYLYGCKSKVVFDFADDLLSMLEVELKITNKNIIYKFANYLLSLIINRSDVVISISAPLHEKVNHKQKYIIPNGAHINNINSELGTSSTENNKFTIGYVGAFEYSMALDQAIEAAEQLPQFQFLLVGAGRDYGRIENTVKNKSLKNVKLTGAVPHQKAMELINSMNICLNLFHKTDVSHAVSPLKLFEYLSHRKPVISTRLNEVLRIDEGFLYYGDTVEEIIEKICYIFENLEEANKKALLGYQVVKNKFSWERIAKKFLDVTKNL
jgi:glycosyltransferase involved in cell wall biosynthesis